MRQAFNDSLVTMRPHTIERLNKRQRGVIEGAPPVTGCRRVKGPAGSGKSLMLAAKARYMANERKRVLVVCYNITVRKYLRGLSESFIDARLANTALIEWQHFHRWARGVCRALGRPQLFRNLLDSGSITGDLKGSKLFVDTIRASTEDGSYRPQMFDAILVDEGQDFNLDWWNALREHLVPGGEMLLVADRVQDLYGRSDAWTELAMNDAGFRGPWYNLSRSYRIHPHVAVHLKTLTSEYFPSDTEVDLPNPVYIKRKTSHQSELVEEPVLLKWVQVREDQLVPETVAMIMNADSWGNQYSVRQENLVFLTDTHYRGLEVVERLRNAGIPVMHIFSEDENEQRNLKNSFNIRSHRVKGCTVKSFKSLESRGLIVMVSPGGSRREMQTLYTALTRHGRDAIGSALIVVCAEPSLERFGERWSDFTSLGS